MINTNFHNTLPTMAQSPTREDILTAVAVNYRNDLTFLEELNSLSWSLKVRLKAQIKQNQENEQRLD